MGMYGFSIAPTSDPVELNKYDSMQAGEALQSAWADHCSETGKSSIPGADANGAYLLTAQDFRNHPDILNALWGISEVGFGKILGAHHPMSMEVTREFFENSLLADGVFAVVRYHEGEPVCFGSLAMDLDHNDWIDCDSTALQASIKTAKELGETPVHFFELISDGSRGIAFSPDVLGLVLDLAGRTGRHYNVYFESTNLSATYIPKIVKQQVEKSDKVKFTDKVHLLGKLHYWYMKHVVNQQPIR